MGLFDDTKPFKGQKYKDLKQHCIKNGKLFTDPLFPANYSSLNCKKASDIEWKRPGEIVENPKFLVEGVSSNDFSQGALGNCWFVAACASLAKDSKLWKKVIPDSEEQEWTEKNKYSGIFHFKFWRCGQWVDVVIDDFLPTRHNTLVYVHSRTANEFWSALLEKAYAKLAGDYAALDGGFSVDALVDMTGGVGECLYMRNFETQEKRQELFRILKQSQENHSLMGSSITDTSKERESKTSSGLVTGHAYSITAVKRIKLGKGLFSIFSRDYLEMVRCRNPWGGSEWTGAWSDGSEEWKKVSNSQKKDIGLTSDEDGEFWMSFEDFCHHFTEVEICHIINMSIFSFKKTWREAVVRGTWSMPDRAGGCGNNTSFLCNPQYIFDVTENEDEVLVSLEQQDKRDKGKDNYSIGFTVIKTDINRKFRMHDRYQEISSISFQARRSVFGRLTLKRGRYCIIPSTFDPNETGDFVLRMYASSKINLRELVNEEPKPATCCRSPYLAATQITIDRAEKLEAQDRGYTADPYCIVKYEGKKVENHYIEKTLDPKWNDRITVYRKKPYHDIIVEVWNHNILKDQLMGFATIPMDNPRKYTNSSVITAYKLSAKGKEGLVEKPGVLWLTVLHTEHMDTV
ncbi:calpain-5-like [Mercenaria mercenaria]|uniref:calpain-5-like n=1 Tax=Mercenaria mercenaria TaxID=6596 RepID=UPI00234E3B3E|nr:calpain-5-like [Mercenaria mercenaria]XP_053403576.1 calpain-5-like [Mercenaria mercenaria]XP_053403577.1 calpain-5-like [Mercenaria mercenaria]